MEYAIKLRLSGMMQGYSESRYIYKRKTMSMPGKSAILGMIAAAEGILRSEKDALSELEQSLTIEIEKPKSTLQRLTDFQTVRPVQNSKIARASGTNKKYLFNTANGIGKDVLPLMEKEYVLDGTFNVTIRGKENDVLKAAEALRHPIFPLYLGRKCCPPSEAIFQKLEMES